jgi:multiple sugar transport system substrate-binding protein
MTDTEPIQMFQSGNVAMYYGGSWRAPRFAGNEYTRDRVDVAPMPEGDQRAGVIHGLGNVIFSGTENPEEAWEFVEFLSSEEAARIQAESGVVIPAYEGTQDAWVQALPQYDLQVFLDAVEYSQPMPVSENTAAWQAEEVEHLTPAWAGAVDVATAAQQLDEAVEAHLAEEQG